MRKTATQDKAKRRKTLVDLREFPAALELARNLYREEGNLRQSQECVQIAELLGLSNIAVWHAYQRGDLDLAAVAVLAVPLWALPADQRSTVAALCEHP